MPSFESITTAPTPLGGEAITAHRWPSSHRATMVEPKAKRHPGFHAMFALRSRNFLRCGLFLIMACLAVHWQCNVRLEVKFLLPLAAVWHPRHGNLPELLYRTSTRLKYRACSSGIGSIHRRVSAAEAAVCCGREAHR